MSSLFLGCPVVGVRTGASLIMDGVNGLVVDRLPSGQDCVESSAYEIALNTYREVFGRAMQMDRSLVRDQASADFSIAAIVD